MSAHLGIGMALMVALGFFGFAAARWLLAAASAALAWWGR